MIISKRLPSIILTLLTLGVIVFSVNRWGGALFKTLNPSTAVPTVKPVATVETSVPEEFIDFENTSDVDDYATKAFAKLSTDAIWQNLLTGFQPDHKPQIGLENTLIARLRKESGNTIYEELLSRFRQGLFDTNAQQILVSILGEVGNDKAAKTLIQLVIDGLLMHPDVKLAAFRAISKFSPDSWRDHSNAKLAPLFEAAWQVHDPEFLSAIANVMASIGTPSTLDIFISTLTETHNTERADIVRQAMANLVNPELIPKLIELLHKSPVEDVQIASGYALANMGQLDAAIALFKWATRINADQLDATKMLIETATNTTPEFIDYLDTHVAEQSFVSPEIKHSIEDVLQDVKSGVE